MNKSRTNTHQSDNFFSLKEKKVCHTRKAEKDFNTFARTNLISSMILINSQFLKVGRDEVQEKIDQKISIFKTIHSDAKPINLSSGDVVLPLLPCVVEAMAKGVYEMGDEATFKGRAPAQGYPFLIEAIVKHNYKKHKIRIDEDEVFINDGTKEELAGIGDILCRDNRIAVIDPVFQTYIESNVIGNRAGELTKDHHWSHIIYLESSKENHFMPEFPKVRPDVIYLSYPNDPTGCVMTRDTLEQWVRYALKNDVLILFDATYESFITEPGIPHSIYEIKGARKTAIEFRSFSKSAAFTGLHCGYTVIPKDIAGYSFTADQRASLNALWRRRQAIKNYSPAYIIQRGAEALYTEAGMEGVSRNVNHYMTNASLLRKALSATKLNFWGGVNSPYIWIESPYATSWKLFDKLLNECHIVSSPGERFGPRGKGFVRLSAFANQTKVMIASTRISDLTI